MSVGTLLFGATPVGPVHAWSMDAKNSPTKRRNNVEKKLLNEDDFICILLHRTKYLRAVVACRPGDCVAIGHDCCACGTAYTAYPNRAILTRAAG